MVESEGLIYYITFRSYSIDSKITIGLTDNNEHILEDLRKICC